MNKLLFLFFLISFSCFSQKKYEFNYFTEYEYKETFDDTLNTQKEINYSNTNDSGYFLRIIKKKDTIFSAELYDSFYGKVAVFKSDSYRNEINDIASLKNPKVYNFSLTHCKKSQNNFYEISYRLENGKNGFNIKRFKNYKKKKLINESFFETTPSEITKNQHYNFNPLINPLWCNKFVLENTEVISYSYFIEDDEVKYLRKLLKIEKENLSITISN